MFLSSTERQVFNLFVLHIQVLQDWKLILIIVCIVSFDTVFIILPFNIAALFSDDVKLQIEPNAESGKNVSTSKLFCSIHKFHIFSTKNFP